MKTILALALLVTTTGCATIKRSVVGPFPPVHLFPCSPTETTVITITTQSR